MRNRELLKALRPLHDEARYETEPFDDYQKRVAHLLSNWPECPMREWLHRHHQRAVYDYGWLHFDTMTYDRVTWDKDKIYNEVQTRKMETLEGWGVQILNTPESMRTPLQRLFLASGTWPAPIIVLDNPTALVAPYGMPLGQPYHLLEGHLRLGYFRNLYREKPDAILNAHEVWLARVPPRSSKPRKTQGQ